MKKYIVELTSEERKTLMDTIQAERMAAHKRLHAQMLLKLDQGPDGPGWTDAQVAEAFDCRPRTAERLRQRLVECEFEGVLEHGNIGAHRVRKLDGVAEAHAAQHPDGFVGRHVAVQRGQPDEQRHEEERRAERPRSLGGPQPARATFHPGFCRWFCPGLQSRCG